MISVFIECPRCGHLMLEVASEDETRILECQGDHQGHEDKGLGRMMSAHIKPQDHLETLKGTVVL